jgi:glucose-1-phosphate adenylyltransferase
VKNVLGIINLHENEELLKEITRYRPLAAVPFGGRFRLIDFVLSSMVNSGVQAVGIVVKQNYRSLMDHLRSGKEWDLARKRDGLFLLPPPGHIHYSNSIYKGDLEHFHAHVDFFKQSKQQYVLIAGSHTICNVNFQEMMRFHIERQADITILYKEELPVAGKTFALATVLQVADDGRVTDMRVTSGRMAGGSISMEVYIMAKDLFLQMIEDGIARGEFDFAKEGIAKYLRNFRVYAFPFKSFMAKINSIQGYYQANMELLRPEVWQELFTQAGPIYTKVKDEAPANYRESACVSNSLVANGCVIEGQVEDSILFRKVKIHKGVSVKGCILMQNTVVGPNAILENIICDKDVVINSGKRLIGDRNYVMVIEKGITV